MSGHRTAGHGPSLRVRGWQDKHDLQHIADFHFVVEIKVRNMSQALLSEV